MVGGDELPQVYYLFFLEDAFFSIDTELEISKDFKDTAKISKIPCVILGKDDAEKIL